ncbi:hypothetical protein Plhal304r1_c012g0048261 [Plasmopara halstedii]
MALGAFQSIHQMNERMDNAQWPKLHGVLAATLRATMSLCSESLKNLRFGGIRLELWVAFVSTVKIYFTPIFGMVHYVVRCIVRTQVAISS